MANLTAVLDKVNAARVAAGAAPLQSLPKGQTGSAQSCPLARAFRDVFPNARVGGSLSSVPRNRAHAVAAAMGGRVSSINGDADVELPSELSRFVSDFDNRHHPELIA